MRCMTYLLPEGPDGPQVEELGVGGKTSDTLLD